MVIICLRLITVNRPVEAFDLKGVEPGKAKRAALSVWYQEGAKKVGYEGVVHEPLRQDEDEWALGGLPE